MYSLAVPMRRQPMAGRRLRFMHQVRLRLDRVSATSCFLMRSCNLQLGWEMSAAASIPSRLVSCRILVGRWHRPVAARLFRSRERWRLRLLDWQELECYLAVDAEKRTAKIVANG